MMARIRTAVIGTGFMGRVHLEALRRVEHVNVVEVAATSREKAQAAADGFGVLNATGDWRDIVQDPSIDAVHVTTPNVAHFPIVKAALEAGKHIVCEKPMALTKADCEAVIFKALRMNKNVFCVMQNRFSPPSVWLKNIVENRIIGDIYMVQLNCYWNRDERYYKKGSWKGTQQLDGGTLFTQFSHFIDIMYWLFGDIKDIQAKFNDFNHTALTDFEDSGFVNFNFVGGGMGSINYATAVWNSNLESSLTIIGSRGSIKVGGQYMDQVEYCNIRDYTLPDLAPTNEANDYGAYKGSANNHPQVIENVIDTLKGRTTITTNALEGMKVVDIIERIYALRRENRKS